MWTSRKNCLVCSTQCVEHQTHSVNMTLFPKTNLSNILMCVASYILRYFLFSPSLFRYFHLRVPSSVQQWSATYKNYLSGYRREMPGMRCTYTIFICTSAGTGATSIPVSGTGYFGKRGTTSIPVSSIRVPSRTYHWKIWLDFHRKFRHRGNFLLVVHGKEEKKRKEKVSRSCGGVLKEDRRVLRMHAFVFLLKLHNKSLYWTVKPPHQTSVLQWGSFLDFPYVFQ